MNGVVTNFCLDVCNKNRTTRIRSSGLYLTPNHTIHFMFFVLFLLITLVKTDSLGQQNTETKLH